MYDLLFTFNGHENFASLYAKVSAYDKGNYDSLTEGEKIKLYSFDTTVRLIMAEIRRQCMPYHMFIVLTSDPSAVANNLYLRNRQDAVYNAYEYTLSQNYLFNRMADRLPSGLCTIVWVDHYIDTRLVIELLRQLDRVRRNPTTTSILSV